MTPTPRTDAIAHRGLGSVAYIAEMTDFARELERELAVWKHESKRLEDELEQERQDRKQADLDTIRALGERNEARLERDTALRDLAAERELADRLQKSAQALVDRWETPFWKDVPHTGKFIRSLDDTLAAWKEARRGTC